jgi:hypothetical protein
MYLSGHLLFQIIMKKVYISLVVAILLLIGGCGNSVDLDRADITLHQIISHYDAGFNSLFNETFPYREDGRVTYLAGADTLQGRRVAYLWPTSGLFTAVNMLLQGSGDKKYEAMLDTLIIPGLQNYFDTSRQPACYQSYIIQANRSDRFYDDNVWIALDYLEAYRLTGNSEYLERSKLLWEFIISGWDDKAGGGIYWNEQRKLSRNTCSNAPAAVLAFKLFKTTDDHEFFERGQEIYFWTKETLQDKTDYLYFDNIDLDGKVDKRKYAYNSGQMMQAAAMLYKITGEKSFLEEAEKIGISGIFYFTEDFQTADGKSFRLFKRTDNWFIAVMMRGYTELYNITNDPEFLLIFKDNMDHLWENVRDENGLFSKDWSGKVDDQYKWLLDQASLVEMWASLAASLD